MSSTLIVFLLLATSALYLLSQHIHLRTIPCLATPYLPDPDIPLPKPVHENSEKYVMHHKTVYKPSPVRLSPSSK
ncbi:hypothetical protein HBH53_060380 [Parastagonospora nodorum]|nr:hypothetical protein HBH53_060380 [Parastagonospora nodorum]KAH3975525.1 hypothetical protein HBH52_126470 [Parastagonospora nodorum]KAH4811462.1 hypothetical protein HBH61_088890 [Parastagonospora nodorum]KAH5078398.1 hypothetical protein HBH95_097180 [Parastagonospora nodorum]KAH5103259.1 hypothetical protein HBH72_079980 [Parastagonospora nodorum]